MSIRIHLCISTYISICVSEWLSEKRKEISSSKSIDFHTAPPVGSPTYLFWPTTRPSSNAPATLHPLGIIAFTTSWSETKQLKEIKSRDRHKRGGRDERRDNEISVKVGRHDAAFCLSSFQSACIACIRNYQDLFEHSEWAWFCLFCDRCFWL